MRHDRAMSDKPPLPKPSSDARAGIKDAARMLRHGVRKAGKDFFETPKETGRGAGTDRPSLSGSMRELALAADRFAARTEKRLTSLLWPGETAPMPAMQPEAIRAVLAGTASEQIVLSLMRQMRQWLKHALVLDAQNRAIILEKPLRDALLASHKHKSAQLPEAAATLFAAIRTLPCVRISSLSMSQPGQPRLTAETIIARAVVSVIVAMLAAAGRKSKAPQPAAQMIEAAHALIGEDPVFLDDQSAIARRFDELAVLV
jgi:hypothetical protein